MVGRQRKRVGDDGLDPKRREQPVDGRRRQHSGRFPLEAGGLVTDLWFSWEGEPRNLEVVLVTVNGTIAGAFPVRVARGERLPVHRRFVPRHGAATWYLRLSGEAPIAGLKVEVEVRDLLGRAVAWPLCEAAIVAPGRVTTVEGTVAVPEEV